MLRDTQPGLQDQETWAPHLESTRGAEVGYPPRSTFRVDSPGRYHRTNKLPVEFFDLFSLTLCGTESPQGGTTMKELLHFITHFAQLLEAIPATFWGVIAGSLFSVGGVYFTNRAGDRRLERQLTKDRELKDREREMTFRKDTFTAAAEAISASMSALSKFSDLGFSLKEISQTYLEKSAALAKVNLVAGEDTIRALADFEAEFAGAFLRLTRQRMTRSVLQEQIAAKAALLEGFGKTRDAMLELMRHHNIEGVQDSRRFEAIQKNYQFEADRITTAHQEIQQMLAELSAKQVTFATECFVESARVNQRVIPLLVAARRELEIPISEEQYAEILQQAQSRDSLMISSRMLLL